MDERRGRSRVPLRIILTAVLIGGALWLAELYMDPTWAKIRSFVLGYFIGSFIMEWINQRASRAPVLAPPAPAARVEAPTG
jgi:hypothetical protein